MNILLAGIVKLLMVAGMLLYTGLVLMSYRTDGPDAPLRVNYADPARSVERIMVWLGVRALAVGLGIATAVFNLLSEASAEVGEWFIRRRSPEVQAEFRSRFLV
jgi:hypothetical protein